MDNVNESPVSTREAATRLDINYSMLRRLIATGDVPAPDVGPVQGGGFGRLWTSADLEAAREALNGRKKRAAAPPSIWDRHASTIQRTYDQLAVIALQMQEDPEVPEHWRERLSVLTGQLTFPEPPRTT